MKILFVNTNFFMFGGAEKYLFDTAKLLEENGHKIIFFAMHHPKNLPTQYSKYFVSYFPPFKEMGFTKKVRYALRFFYNFEAKNKFRKLIQDEKPDLVHINIISYEISHSIILEAKKHKIPIAMTLHDHRIICPQVVMLNNGKICEKCIDGSFFFCIKNKCIFDSLFRSILMALFYYFNRFILKSMHKIDLFISPSEYLRNKMKELKYCNSFNIVVLRHFVDVQKYKPSYEFLERSIVYFGRLSQEKGLEVLLDVIKDLDITLKIIGSGDKEYEQKLRTKVLVEKITNVKFLGYLQGEGLYYEINKSMFSVFPSMGAENCPFAILESFAMGKPVIANAIGGVVDLVKDNETGLLCMSKDKECWRDRIEYLASNHSLLSRMGTNARQFVKKECDLKSYYSKLISIYLELKRTYGIHH